MKNKLFIILIVFVPTFTFSQSDSLKGTFWKPNPANYKVKQAI